MRSDDEIKLTDFMMTWLKQVDLLDWANLAFLRDFLIMGAAAMPFVESVSHDVFFSSQSVHDVFKNTEHYVIKHDSCRSSFQLSITEYYVAWCLSFLCCCIGVFITCLKGKKVILSFRTKIITSVFGCCFPAQRPPSKIEPKMIGAVRWRSTMAMFVCNRFPSSNPRGLKGKQWSSNPNISHSECSVISTAP